MTIHQIECFLEAARTLNFTEAANHLYISQQGLSRQIASLEKELELRLFDRTTRDVRLTRSGELLLWRWKDIPKEIYDSVDMAREEGVKGHIISQYVARHLYDAAHAHHRQLNPAFGSLPLLPGHIQGNI